jgi:hypothetical protein
MTISRWGGALRVLEFPKYFSEFFDMLRAGLAKINFSIFSCGCLAGRG